MCTSFRFVLLSAEGPTRKDLRAAPAGIKKERINGRKGSKVALEDLCYFAIIADAKEENTTK